MRALRVWLATLLGVVTLVAAAPTANASTQTDFIQSLVSAAQENQRTTGIPASVTIGMAALETGWGRSSMAKPPMNTLFNIKCTAKKSPYQKGCSEVPSYEYDSDGGRYLKVSGFRTYANTGDSLKDFGRFLTTLSRYKAAFKYTNDPDRFVREVHRGGYATDPRYTDLVTGIMRSYNLYRYDVSTKPDPVAPTPAPKRDFLTQTYGNLNTNVTTLQRLLNLRMGRSIVENGSYGWQTQDAVADFQAQVMRVKQMSGDADRATWQRLVPTLKQGDRGGNVVALQMELRYTGYATVPVDGVFGASTRAAVEDFQRKQGLPVTGTAATLTWGRMLGM
ncbi:glucosaminidase domain-containing protein [uncultured Tessaracoccus sp.]|uniref:glucosaminidase domain-containing protein n=1 Tax=uncultured Tessaracoccus sp. TaxID=905023 RepID=UPI0025D8F5D9|nr:glucosaminidase domain-containing protein [uncultured Tessaracoccus sp.]